MRIALALVASLATAAAADPPPGAIMKATPPSKVCAAKFEIQVINLKRLESALALAPAQKPLFDAWKTVRIAIARAWPCPAPPTGLDVPMPQRLDHQIAMMSFTLEALRKEQPSALALYDALAPAQRATFDGPASAPPPAQKPD